MGDFFAFRKMITPYVIQVIFWVGVVAIVVGGVAAISQDEALLGLLVLIFGVLYWRIVCEVFIVFFRIHDTLRSIKGDTGGIPAALATSGWPPDTGGTRTEEPVARDKGDEHPSAATAIVAAAPVAAMPREGWYDDSSRPGHKRWWDGTAWGMRDDEHPSVVSGTSRADTETAVPPVESSTETGQEPADTAITVEPSSEVAPADAGSSAPQSASVPTRFCENCGAERSPDARFCTNCGHA